MNKMHVLALLTFTLSAQVATSRLKRSIAVQDCYSKDVDLLLVLPRAHSPEVDGFQRSSSASLLNVLLGPNEDHLRRVKAGLISLEIDKQNIDAKMVFNLDEFTTITEARAALKSEATSLIEGVKFQGFTLPVFESTLLGLRQWAKVVVALLMYNLTDDVMHSALKGNVYYTPSSYDRPKPTLMLFTNSQTFKLSSEEQSLGFQVRHVSPYDTSNWSLDILDFAVCEGNNIAWSLAEMMCTDGTSLATIETVEEYEDLRAKLEYTLQEERFELSSDFIEETNVFIDLRRDAASYARHFLWASKRVLIYSRWLQEDSLDLKDENCVVWRFEPKSNSNTSRDISSGWLQVGCGVHIPGRVLCESSLNRQSRVHRLKMTPMQPANRNQDQVLSRGSFAYVKASADNGLIFFHHSMPAVKFLCMLMRCAGSKPYNLDSFQDVTVKVSNIDTKMTWDEISKLDFSLFMFRCNNGYLPYTRVCDRRKDCKNGADEKHCGVLEAAPRQMAGGCFEGTEHQCSNSYECIPIAAKCDLHPDCYSSMSESSDENDCGCDFYQCDSYKCIPQPYDQNNCIDFTFPDQHVSFRDNFESCALHCNRKKCVSFDQLNNGVIDCQGPEGHIDEVWGKLEAHLCKKKEDGREFLSDWSSRCVLLRDRFKQITGCHDMQHLHGCEQFLCPESYVKCPRAHCIPSFAVNDGIPDCPAGEDERVDEPIGVKLGMFQCGDKRYIHPDLVCDGFAHCADSSDELECHVTCYEGFACVGDAVAAINYNHLLELRNLTFISSNVRFLNLSYVMVPNFFTDYQKNSMRKLLYLSLVECDITSIERPPKKNIDSKDFFTLVSLDLSGNKIKSISSTSILSQMYHLVSLNLSRNTFLQDISDSALRGSNGHLLSFLEEIDLSWCGLTYLSNNVFGQLANLNKLYLQRTKLKNFDLRISHSLRILDIRIPELQSINPNSLRNMWRIDAIHTSSFKFCCPQILGPLIGTHICDAPTDALSTCSDLLREPILRVLLWVVGITAVIGNVVVLVYRLWLDKGRKTGLRYFVFHLSVSDLMMGVYLLIIASMDTKFKGEYVLHEHVWRASEGCKVAGFLSTISSETSAIFIFLITLDRFLVIKFPYGDIRLSPLAIHLSCGFAWLVGFVLALIPLLPPFQHWVIYSTNGMCLGVPLSVQRLPGWHYSVSVFVGFNFLLFIMIALGQFAIYRTFSASKSETLKSQSLMENRRMQEIAIAKRLSLVVVSDFLCWFPIGIMGFLAMVGVEIGKEAYSWSAVVVLPINSALNPLLYTMGTLKEKWGKFNEERRSRYTASHLSQMESSMKSTASGTKF